MDQSHGIIRSKLLHLESVQNVEAGLFPEMDDMVFSTGAPTTLDAGSNTQIVDLNYINTFLIFES